MLHMISDRCVACDLQTGPLSIRVGDSLPRNTIIIIIIIIIYSVYIFMVFMFRVSRASEWKSYTAQKNTPTLFRAYLNIPGVPQDTFINMKVSSCCKGPKGRVVCEWRRCHLGFHKRNTEQKKRKTVFCSRSDFVRNKTSICLNDRCSPFSMPTWTYMLVLGIPLSTWR